ncbi:hypothetical protein AAC387_Pa05g0052 [Persea americana]
MKEENKIEREREMENGGGKKVWKFRAKGELASEAHVSIRGMLEMIKGGLDGGDERPIIPLGHGDPSGFTFFRTISTAEDAVVSALRSGKYNCYSPSVGLLPARRAIAEHLSQDLPYKLSSNDVFITNGCTQAIETVMTVLAHPNANILLPRPGFPMYEARAVFCGIQVRHFDLLPHRNWEMDLDAVEGLVDDNTVAIVIINPGNPCGNVFSYHHLAKIAEMAKKHGILVVADEVYGHLTFGSEPFVPMGVFGSVVPVITLGSISKRWVVPGWRIGWLVTTDPNGVLQQTKIVNCIKNILNITSEPVTFIQAAVPDILWGTKEDFFNKTINILKQTSDICYNQIKEINCLTCFNKPVGSMFLMVKINLSLLEDIKDDVDFCCKLAREESVIILPGCSVGLKNWLRITFAIEPSPLEDGVARLKSFCQRHMKKQ